MEWNFTPFNLREWNDSKKRVLFVASEPNGNNPNSGTPDMGDWFRTASSSNKFHKNKKFHNRCKIILRGILNSTDEKEIFSHFRFMDLKATQGGAASSVNELIEYVNLHLDEVLKYFLSSDEKFGISPNIVIVLGNNTQHVFERTVKPLLVNKKVAIEYVFMPHPSAQTVVNKHLEEASSEINSKLVPISSVPSRWFCRGRNNSGWVTVS